MNNEIDIEAELARILQEEIWKEITAETGETKQDLDNKIIAEIVKLKDSLWWGWQVSIAWGNKVDSTVGDDRKSSKTINANDAYFGEERLAA